MSTYCVIGSGISGATIANLLNNKHSDKTTLLNRSNQDAFDLKTYKKFLSFLKFQEMMDEYNI